jgi:cytochrome P450
LDSSTAAKAKSARPGSVITEEEITSQIRTLLAAGYETTACKCFPFFHYIRVVDTDAATLTWTIIELCRNPDLQSLLRAELLRTFPCSDPTYEELTNNLPVLDALVHEVIRLHSPAPETFRTVGCLYYLPVYHVYKVYRHNKTISFRFPSLSYCLMGLRLTR